MSGVDMIPDEPGTRPLADPELERVLAAAEEALTFEARSIVLPFEPYDREEPEAYALRLMQHRTLRLLDEEGEFLAAVPWTFLQQLAAVPVETRREALLQITFAAEGAHRRGYGLGKQQGRGEIVDVVRELIGTEAIAAAIDDLRRVLESKR